METTKRRDLNVFDRAAQLWPVLTLCATQRQILTCGMLAKLIGHGSDDVSDVLAPIAAYCALEKLPALTLLVVGGDAGFPGVGLAAAPNVPDEQARVFEHNWLLRKPPHPVELEAALLRRPDGNLEVSLHSEIMGS